MDAACKRHDECYIDAGHTADGESSIPCDEKFIAELEALIPKFSPSKDSKKISAALLFVEFFKQKISDPKLQQGIGILLRCVNRLKTITTGNDLSGLHILSASATIFEAFAELQKLKLTEESTRQWTRLLALAAPVVEDLLKPR